MALQNEITKELALALAHTGWWKTESKEVVCQFQLFTDLLCMDFDKFHEAMETCLQRPIWTHEFGSESSVLNMQNEIKERFPFYYDKIRATIANKYLGGIV